MIPTRPSFDGQDDDTPYPVPMPNATEPGVPAPASPFTQGPPPVPPTPPMPPAPLVAPEQSTFTPPTPPASGPFAEGPVDALVYQQGDDSPELRAAAAYIPISPKLTIRDSKPRPPQHRELNEWTPGPVNYSTIERDDNESKIPRPVTVLRVLATTVLVTIPIVVGWFLIAYGLSLYTD